MEYKGLHIKIYVFNVTNGEEFLSGEDHKLKIQEVGPFVYQEYRKNKDIEILPEEGILRYTSNMWAQFVPEESVGDPKEVVLNLPNMPLLGITAMLSEFSPIIRNVYNLITLQQNAKPFVLKDVHSYLWNYTDPLVSAANKLIPGFIYFENIGILERLYDKNMIYRMELGATEEDKFQIKWVDKRMRARNTFFSTSMMESNRTYADTYEGMGYPPNLPPSAPRHIYRPGICRTVEMEYIGSSMMDINTEGYKFDFNKRTFENKYLCDSKGYCPDGLLDLSECFFGIPVTLSRGHFNNSDPRLFDRIEGLSPDSGEHESCFYIEPKVGLIIEGKTSLQMNMVMRDVKYSSRVHRFTDMVLPMAHARVKTPPLPDLVQTKLELLFITCYKVQKVMVGTTTDS
ncbi:hypothetical protein K1T71_006410 [Dendrolimus kikuchii]|uniref:Uncharacterized protein n=1 Tax=Dendrolimus kikuchii TaxID=765133 RepID=A0ACC1D1X4_9NEOP|nr:hypothetical protein K1T71_006410 [Dendrolimus kikuchii]